MSKIPCSVIRDLMVLYDDNVCSEESRRMVEEHIAECEECRSLYQKAAAGLPDISLEAEQESSRARDDEIIEFFKNVCKKIERRLNYRYIIIIFSLIVAVIIASTVWEQWLQFRVNIVPSEDVQITELYELESGDIYCTFQCKDTIGQVNFGDIEVPAGKEAENYDKGWQEIYFQYSMPFKKSINEKIFGKEVSVVFPKKVVNSNLSVEVSGEWTYPGGRTRTCAYIYYAGKNKEERMLVWEKGQEIKSAPESIEEKVEEELGKQMREIKGEEGEGFGDYDWAHPVIFY